MDDKERVKELEERLNTLSTKYDTLSASLSALMIIAGEMCNDGTLELREETEKTLKVKFKNNGPIGISFNHTMYDDERKIVDIFCLDANETFVTIMNGDVRNKSYREVFIEIDKDPFDWINACGQVGKTGVPIKFKQFFLFSNKWCECILYRYAEDQFVFGAIDISEQQSGTHRIPGTIPRCSQCRCQMRKILADDEYIVEWWECGSCGEIQFKQ